MRLSDYNPNTSRTAFMQIKHPISKEPMVEDGLELGLFMYSGQSKEAAESRHRMQSEKAEWVTQQTTSLYGPLDPELKGEDLEKAQAKRVLPRDEVRAKDAELMTAHIGRMITGVQGELLDDNYQPYTDYGRMMAEQGWLLHQVTEYYRDIGNFIPKS